VIGRRRKRPEVMKKTAILSLAVFVMVSLSMTAFAQEKKIIIEDKKIRKIEEKGAFLGIYMEDLDSKMIKKLDYPKSTGVLITGIVEDSPAEETGLEEDDVIYSIEGEKVKDSKELGKLIASKEPGDEVKIVVYRDGKKKTFDLALGEKKTAYVTIDMDDYDDIAAEKIYFKTLGMGDGVWTTSGGDHISICRGRGRLGVQVHDLDSDLAPYFKVKEGEGVLVLDVIEDSPAEKAGIKAGDVIVKIGDEEIEEIDDIYESLGEFDFDIEVEEIDDEAKVDVTVDRNVAVTVIRKGKSKVFEVELDDNEAMLREFIIKGPHMAGTKRMEMMCRPKMKGIKLHDMELDVEQEKLELKLKKLEKEMEKLQKKLEELEQND
jgi:C-terminal processing protease CtpA/Prc